MVATTLEGPHDGTVPTLEFGARVRFVATVQRITGTIGMRERYRHGGPLGAWTELKSDGSELALVSVVGGDHWIDPDTEWPGGDVGGVAPPWKRGTFSMLRRFWIGGHTEPAWADGVYLSTSWRTEGQRHPGAKPFIDDEGEPPSFDEWRRVTVHYVAVDVTDGDEELPRGKPRIVMVLPEDMEVAR